MDIISIVILVILAIGLIIGLIKGFPLKKLSFALFVACVGLSYFAGVPLARYLVDTEFGYVTLQGAYYRLLPTTDTFTAIVSSDEQTRLAQLQQGLTELKIPAFFQGIFTGRVIDNTSDVATALASSFSLLTLIAICFALILLISFLLGQLIIHFLGKALLGENGKGFLGRIFGLLLGGSKAIFVVLLVMALASFVNELMLRFNYTVFNDWLDKELYLNDSSVFSVGKFFYQTASSLLLWIRK